MMITTRIFFCALLAFLVAGSSARAELLVTVGEPKPTGGTVLVKLTMKNTYTNAIESARAVVFLIGAKGKVVGQRTEWVIGGTKEKPGLAGGATAVFNLVVPADKPVEKVNVELTRIILEGGKLVQNNRTN